MPTSLSGGNGASPACTIAMSRGPASPVGGGNPSIHSRIGAARGGAGGVSRRIGRPGGRGFRAGVLLGVGGHRRALPGGDLVVAESKGRVYSRGVGSDGGGAAGSSSSSQSSWRRRRSRGTSPLRRLPRRGGSSTRPLTVGDTVRVRTRARGTVAFTVAGIAHELMPMPVIYAPRAAVLEAMGQANDSTRNVRIVTSGHDAASERQAARAVEAACRRDGLPVSQLQRTEDAKQGILDHLVIILSILTTAAVVVVFVGTLGLASTVGLSVVQRTRELGIMSAIGATPATLARNVWLESLAIGLLSFVAAVMITAPITAVLEWACGWIFFKVGLDFYLWPAALGIWFALGLVLATLASLQPAWRASRLTVREALAHT